VGGEWIADCRLQIADCGLKTQIPQSEVRNVGERRRFEVPLIIGFYELLTMFDLHCCYADEKAWLEKKL
jgi:hypothetical protein